MAAYDWLVYDLPFFICNVTWLSYLTKKHYGQVTTTAGHIFELNVLFTATLNLGLLILLVDLEILPMDISSDFFYKIFLYNFLVAVLGSQIETALFMKTLNVNTMMTNTARKIILAQTIFGYGLGVIMTLVLPSLRVHQSEIFSCNFLPPRDFYLTVIPETVGLMLILSVMGFGVFRGLHIRKTRENEVCPDNLSLEEQRQHTGLRGRDTPPQGRQAAISEQNHEAPREFIEEDLVILDMELDNIDTSPSMDNVIIESSQIQETNSENSMNASGMPRNQQYPIECVPLPTGINIILKTIQKYMKNTMISLLMVTSLLPANLLSIYGFITNSGCENPTVRAVAEISEYGYYMLHLFLPYLIKLKLDRLSE